MGRCFYLQGDVRWNPGVEWSLVVRGRSPHVWGGFQWGKGAALLNPGQEGQKLAESACILYQARHQRLKMGHMTSKA